MFYDYKIYINNKINLNIVDSISTFLNLLKTCVLENVKNTIKNIYKYTFTRYFINSEKNCRYIKNSNEKKLKYSLIIQFQQDDCLKEESIENEAAFVCTTSHAGMIQLHLTTESEPVAYLLIGCLKAIAMRLYDTQTDIRLMSYSNDPRRFR